MNIEKIIKKTILKFERQNKYKKEEFKDWLDTQIDEMTECDTKERLFNLAGDAIRRIYDEEEEDKKYKREILLLKETLKRIQNNKKDNKKDK